MAAPCFDLNPLGVCRIPYYIPTYQSATTTGFRIDASTKGVAYFLMAPATEKLTDVYVFVTAASGTPPTITAELYDATSTSAMGSAVSLYSTTATGRSSLGWVKLTFTDGSRAALGIGKNYFLRITTNGDASNYNDIASALSVVSDSIYANWASFTTTNSFSTITLANRNGCPFVATFETKTAGNPYTKVVQPTTNTNPKGFYIPATDGGLIVSGMWFGSPPVIATLDLYRVGSGSAEYSDSVNTNYVNGSITVPRTLLSGIDYRYVLTYSSTNVRPGYLEIEDPDDFPALLLARYGGGWSYTEYISSVWTDYPKRFLNGCVRISGVPASSAAGEPSFAYVG